MKRTIRSIVAGLLLVIAGAAQAQHGWHHHHHPTHSNSNWVGPLIGGVVLGAVIAGARNTQASPPVIINPMPPVVVPTPAVPPLYPGVTYYNCLARVYDPITNTHRNEVLTCVR